MIRRAERFMREARAVGRIDHPNVVDVTTSVRTRQRLYGDGVAARRIAAPAHQRTRSLRRRWSTRCVPAMRGVAAAHQLGVVHRDLKPDNIFLCEAQGRRPGEAKVLDFGVSSMAACRGRRLDADQGRHRARHAGLYVARADREPARRRWPDRCLRVRRDPVRSADGPRPFPAANYAALIFSIVHATPKPLSKYRADVPAGLEQVVLRAFARDPAQRHLGVDELIEELRPFATPSR